MRPFHPFWSLELPRVDGQLLLTPCPGTQQVALSQALEQLRLAGAHGVITLMTTTELEKFELTQLGQQVTQAGMRWFQLPISDDRAPDAEFDVRWQQVLPSLLDLLQDGKHVAIHCRGGSGRTGLVAATILLTLGQPPLEAIAMVKAIRPKALTLATHLQWLHRQSLGGIALAD
ncbi:cyclin-dependent kinase inhibitor 3 family protein [Aeromonas cavernicola]|uniref:Protein tyrosine phosphatase n=1 Tax=Aeromonas cavernicola TaxID=1006623 RepID=A0A2H9U2R7_9GAMM|nr:cyclin-dependent kinase inhibitor 3 family protein [Aeromonas cavernicola]PJG58258.1 protein tyrosine phosphatase [Aeromonas cavernicola]